MLLPQRKERVTEILKVKSKRGKDKKIKR